MNFLNLMRAVLTGFLLLALPAWAGTSGSIAGSVADTEGAAVIGASVKLLTIDGRQIKETASSTTGDFQFFPIDFGDYEVVIDSANYASYRGTVHVSSGSSTQVDAHLLPRNSSQEMVIRVRAKKHLIQNSAAVSNTEITRGQISALPQGGEISLPRLLATTTPGAVQGPFGQTFFRGNHANIQYQIDGVQLPDSPSNTFGQAFSPRNIDHMEVITGGIPAEYGERLAAVVNILTKSGPEIPSGEVQLNYGSYDTFSPNMLYGGSTESGVLHYFASANYNQTSRGLDTPQPKDLNTPEIGGEESVHNKASGNNEFVKLDWLMDNSNKFTLIGFNSANNLQIPNFPSSYRPTDAIFNNPDKFGNSPLLYTPANTDDYQSEVNAYLQAIWKHSFSDRSFLQVAPYYKYAYIKFQNDPVNDLVSAGSYSFYESRNVNNYGLKTDYTLRPNDVHLVKVGFQLQSSLAQGRISLQQQGNAPVGDEAADKGTFESVYAQDDYTLVKGLVLNAGLRFDATQFSFGEERSGDSMLQPRIGLNYMITDTTKIHIFYGKLFQPSPVENLRETTQKVSGISTLQKYDIKAEKDDYYEIGVAQQFLETHVAQVNVYYKDATNMLDDAQLFNTSIAQPYNYRTGYAYGAEFSVKGELASHWFDYFNYAYEIAKGRGINGGLFIFQGTGNAPPSDEYKFLDHVQVQTANAGLTYRPGQLWWTTQALFGSGLRTDPANGTNLPPHLTFDTTVGYEFRGDTWASKFRVSADVLNIFDNPYAISIANGFNGSHYAAGREFFIRLTKEL